MTVSYHNQPNPLLAKFWGNYFEQEERALILTNQKPSFGGSTILHRTDHWVTKRSNTGVAKSRRPVLSTVALIVARRKFELPLAVLSQLL